jgi:hypothetical protein
LEVEGESVAIITQGIALKSVTLLLVWNAQLDSATTLEPKRLLVDAQALPWDPHPPCFLVFISFYMEKKRCQNFGYGS